MTVPQAVIDALMRIVQNLHDGGGERFTITFPVSKDKTGEVEFRIVKSTRRVA